MYIPCLVLLLATVHAVPAPQPCPTSLRIAVIGEGVIGTSTALAIKELEPESNVEIFHDKDFDDILSKGIAGLFRIDEGTAINRIYGRDTFNRLAYLWRTQGGFSGVQLVSGHILSQHPEKLDSQWANYGDIVYNYHNISKREMFSQFAVEDLDSYTGIHYTAFTSEGARYVPWMKEQLQKKYGVKYTKRKISSVEELADEGYDIIVNSAGLAGGKVAGDGDDANMYPIRGVILKTKASWQKHFLYKDFLTFTIPTIDAVYVGTVKTAYNDTMVADDDTCQYVLDAYLKLQPAFKGVEVVDRFVGLRPARRGGVRVEKVVKQTTDGKKRYTVVHNYGHGGNGFTLGWGSSVHAAKLALRMDVREYEEAMAQSKNSLSKPPYGVDLKQ